LTTCMTSLPIAADTPAPRWRTELSLAQRAEVLSHSFEAVQVPTCHAELCIARNVVHKDVRTLNKLYRTFGSI
jgi:hypothetical protein